MTDLIELMVIVWAILAGTILVVVLEWPIDRLMVKIDKAIELPKPTGMSQTQFNKLNKLTPGGKNIGQLERGFFFITFLIGAPELIAVWMAFKVASKWEVWNNVYKVPNRMPGTNIFDWFLFRKSLGAKIYQRFLVGMLANILAAMAGAGVIRGTIALIKHLS